MKVTGRAAAVCVLLAAGLVVLHGLGSGDLGAPPTAPTAWPGWVAAVGPAAAVVACLRLAGIVLGWYLLAVTALWWVSARSARASACFERLVPQLLRRVLGGAAGATLTVTAIAVVAHTPQAVAFQEPAADAPPSEPGDGGLTPAIPRLQVGSDAHGSEGRPGDSAPPTGPTARLERFRFVPRPLDLPAPAPPEPVLFESWSVRCGDHFWAIAREVLIDAGRVDPSAGEVDRYWRRLVRHNADRLIDPSNPDLILPGQEFELPPIAESGPERVSGR